ncbi:SDR family oxidoreductase [Dactylosporangium sp. NPDC049742]|uniref:SDR family NAD(P)-dependent oxidoreductase n=1 Tax=unclassified Dactylosporangium TaxID=2621675 RepID=UPI003443FADB
MAVTGTAGLAGRVALVTGGGSGIGAAISARLADEGAHVLVGQRTPQTAAAAASRLAAPHRSLDVAVADLADAASCRALVARCVERFGGIDILVNNAAVTGPGASRPLLDCDDEWLDRVVGVNLTAAFRCSREAARCMVARGTPGVIVNIGSVAAYAAQHHATAYTTTKAGMLGLTRGLAFELAPHNIRAVHVAPGDIALDERAGTPAPPPELSEPQRWWERHTPLGRRGHPDDVASMVAYLCSAEAGFVTGASILVDGGWLSY